MNDLNPPFSVEEFFAKRVEPRWECLKEEGNALFKKGDYQNSVKVYSQALYVSLGSLKSIPALFAVLRKMKAGSPGKAISENLMLLLLISRYLPAPLTPNEYTLINGHVVVAHLPNLPAAVCYSNRSAAYMKLASAATSPELSKKYLKKALRDAKLACKQCPGYAKGHFRIFQAQSSLGNLTAANKKKKQLELYERYVANMPWLGIAALAIGWLSLIDFQFIHGTIRFQEVMRRLADSPPIMFSALAMLVSFMGGQFMVVSIKYMTADCNVHSVDSLYFVCTDERGGEDLQRGPCGIATKTSMHAVKGILALFFKALASHGMFTH